MLMLALGFLIGVLSTIIAQFFLRELARKRRDAEFSEIMRIAIEREAEEAAWREKRPRWRQHRGVA